MKYTTSPTSPEFLVAAAFYGLNTYGQTSGMDIARSIGIAEGIDIAKGIGIAEGVLALITLATVAQMVWMLWRRRKEYVLLIESAGVVRGLLASRDSNVIHDVSDLITASMRRPPSTAIHKYFNNVTTNVNTDIKQYGNSNIGQQFNR
ncbi:MAG: hypothetical protein LC808_32600 [Actinobacteria bacterium]|nr:hypothetical protein [Actinomycetota bacterium]